MPCGRMIGPFHCCSLIHGNALELLTAVPNRSAGLIFADFPFQSDLQGLDVREFMTVASAEFMRIAKPVCNLVGIHYPRAWWVFEDLFRPFWKLRSEIPLVKNGWRYTFVNGALPGKHQRTLFLYTGPLMTSKWNPDQGKHQGLHPDVVNYKAGSLYHESSKSLKRTQDWVRWMSDPDDLVIDPFAGSGTTLAACLRLGRHFLGFEIDLGNFAIATERLKRYGYRTLKEVQRMNASQLKKQFSNCDSTAAKGQLIIQAAGERKVKFAQIGRELGLLPHIVGYMVKRARKEGVRTHSKVAVPANVKTRGTQIRVKGVSVTGDPEKQLIEMIKQHDTKRVHLVTALENLRLAQV